jgi:hypothetical protein
VSFIDFTKVGGRDTLRCPAFRTSRRFWLADCQTHSDCASTCNADDLLDNHKPRSASRQDLPTEVDRLGEALSNPGCYNTRLADQDALRRDLLSRVLFGLGTGLRLREQTILQC